VTRRILAERCFSPEDQEVFARLSGDRNPIHLDPVAARRSLAKQPIAHGVHVLLWALDRLCAEVPDLPAIGAIRIRFEKMIPVGASVRAVFAPDAKGGGRLEVLVDDAPALVCLPSFGAPLAGAPASAEAPSAVLDAPQEPRLEDMAGMRGCAPFAASLDEARARFPSVCRSMGASRVAGLMACSYIVGMLCPGLSSIFRSLKLTAAEPRGEEGVGFAVDAVDDRFRLVRVNVEGAGWIGALEAHIAPAPVAQPSMAEALRRIAPGEFEGVRALVVGGSRGLGEMIGKIVAAGGGEAILTYRLGEADARRVEAEIAAAGGRARRLRFDAERDDPATLAQHAPNQLYYMATPAIMPGPAAFSAEKFEAFLRIYVHSFRALVMLLAERRAGDLSVFYPSTVFLDDPRPGLAEYAMAKAAGEALCASLGAERKLGRYLMKRLPRLPTDQTLALSSEPLADPLELLLPLVREMSAPGAAR
jgi:hypothetical protein